MPKLKFFSPKYSRHKGTGQAVVRVRGRDRYLGRFGSPESYRRYQQVVAEWMASHGGAGPCASTPRVCRDDYRISELLVAYLNFAEEYYRKDGRPTGELPNLKEAARPLARRFGDERVADFGPSKLKTVRQALIDSGLCRNVINARINRIRRVFKWGVENELVEPAVLQALQAIAPLKQGRSAARETEDVKPVPEGDIEAVCAIVSPQIRAMIETQRLTGMRPGELVIIRPCDIDRRKSIWVYRPRAHKSEHHGIDRQIYVGPRAQRILQPFMLRRADAYLFSPRESMFEHQRKRKERSKNSRIRKSEQQRVRIQSQVGAGYTRKSYHNAIYKACRKLGIAPWGPNRLRHNAATSLREQFGIEAARVILGHTSAAMTEVYAELDRSKAADIMGRVG